jgi:hypothetical protein
MGAEARPPTDSDANPPRAWPFGLLLTAETLALAAVMTPYHRFSRFAYSDSGADLTIRDLIARGLRPTIDFGYIYGLLPLLINRAWYGLWGPSPEAHRALAVLCGVATAWGLARLAASLRVGWAGAALIVLTLPDAMLVVNIVLVQALEPALLVHALADQAAGRRSRALALLTACAFVKPSMAYLYGFLLVATVVVEALRGGGWRWLARQLAPAVLTGLALSAVLGAVYGLRPLVNTLLPGAGMEVYRQGGYGFFHGAGRAFWWRPGVGLRGYLRYEVGYWLVGSLVLTAGGLAALARLASDRGGRPWREIRRDEVVTTCAALHVAFVTLFFGNRLSWVYYLVVLIAGLAAMAGRGGLARGAVWGLAAMVLLSDRSWVNSALSARASVSRGPDTAGLWATRHERNEWRKVLALTEGSRPALLANIEGAALFYPRFAPPVVSYLVPGHPVPVELRRKAEQLAAAPMVVRVRTGSDPAWGGYERWPELAAALDGLELVWRGEIYEVFRRVRPPSDRGLHGRGMVSARGAARRATGAAP